MITQKTQVTMTCGHLNQYLMTAPKMGQSSWCPRCDQFQEVTARELIPIPGEELKVGYAKRVELTNYISSQPLNKNHYF